jgi:multicomponent Na+:H+ antiporter subunit D
MIYQHLPVLIIVLFFVGALVTPLVAPLGRRVPLAMAFGAALVAFGLAVYGLVETVSTGVRRYFVGGWEPPIGIELVWDPLSAFIVVVIAAVAALALWHSKRPVETELPGRSTAYYSCTQLLLGGLCGIVLTGDLFNLYVFLEISALAGYALLAASGGRAAVFTFRYLLLGTTGASFYLLGIGFIFLETGSLNMADVARILAVTGIDPQIALGLALVVAGAGMKMALFPLHGWLPDVYSAAPTTSVSLMAPIGTKVAAYILIRIFLHVFPPATVYDALPIGQVVGAMGAVGIIWGSVMAIAQRDLRRMLAYSSVAQIGYIALGLGLGSAFGFIGAVLHILNHAAMKACLFLVSGNLAQAGYSQDIGSFDKRLRQRLPWTAAAFTIAAISMIGLPPTAGFFSKWYLLLGSWQQSNWIYVAVILISSLLNAVYFFRVIERMYLVAGDEPATGKPVGQGGLFAIAREGPLSLVAPAVALGFAVIALGLANAYIVTRIIQPMIPIAF